MDGHAWLAGSVVSAAVAAMALNVAGPDLILTAGLTLLLAAGVVTAEQALVGFASPAVLTIAALFVVARGVEQTGGLDFLSRRVLGSPRTAWTAQLRLMLPAAAMSAFVNNTPVVAMLVPLVRNWAKRSGLSPSRLMMPLSFAAILGGSCTLIGSSTNLVVAGMAQHADPPVPLGLLDVTVLGLPALAVGMLFILLSSPWLLPVRDDAAPNPVDPREYTVAMRVDIDSPVVGQTIEEAGLRHLPGLFLVEIERSDQLIVAVAPDERLSGGDVLVFAGLIESVVDLRRIRGLSPATNQVDKLFRPSDRRRLMEAVVGAQSPLVGKNIRDTRFRSRFGAAIIAVHRSGQRIKQKVGDIVLNAGDTLLLETNARFLRNHRNDGTFALVSEVEGSEAPRYNRAPISLSILLVMVALQASGMLPLLTAGLLAAGAMLVTRCITGTEARRSLDLRVLLTIAAAFGLGQALAVTGIADFLAQEIVVIAEPFDRAGVLAAIYVTTGLLTNLVSNNAAAALMFPVTAAVAERCGLALTPTLCVLMVAASASFATPIGYQTNLMVLGPGGYRFSDFVRFGLPLQVLVGGVAILAAMWWWPEGAT